MIDGSELDPRYIDEQRFLRRVRALLMSGATFVALMIAFVAADGLMLAGRLGLGGAWVAVVPAAAWLAETWPRREYACTRYRLDADGLLVARGVFWRTVTHVPRSRVQHTDVSQGPIERKYGLGTLIVYTAGTDRARVALPGLAWETAVALRDELRLEQGHDDV
jgi:membrane protein YdbS with pleckstrin-like domain